MYGIYYVTFAVNPEGDKMLRYEWHTLVLVENWAACYEILGWSIVIRRENRKPKPDPEPNWA